ncbi:hypothetical protein [Collimonas pratensis]|nr:hypothetical protein [Collimonas pratensis]
MAEIESLVRRSCVALQTFGVTVVGFGQLGGKPAQSQKEIDAAAAKLATLATAAQSTLTADAATLATITATWAASAHKAQRIADLTNEMQAAQGVLDLANSGTLPDGTSGMPEDWPAGAPAPTQAAADQFSMTLADFIASVVNGGIHWDASTSAWIKQEF